MRPYDFENSIGYWLIITARSFERSLNDLLVPQGITFRQCQILGWLALSGDLTQADLAEKMGIEPPTMLALLDRMERDGWVQRLAHPEDRRKKIIRPTPRAEPIWAKITGAARSVRTRATAGMEPDDAEALIRLLQRILANLGETSPPHLTSPNRTTPARTMG